MPCPNSHRLRKSTFASPVYLDPLAGALLLQRLPLNYRTPTCRSLPATIRSHGRPQRTSLPATRNNDQTDIVANQGAECLYMIIMNACGDGEARTLFPESSIGDTDGDGAPEFLDGWGTSDRLHPLAGRASRRTSSWSDAIAGNLPTMRIAPAPAKVTTRTPRP